MLANKEPRRERIKMSDSSIHPGRKEGKKEPS